MMIWIKHGEFEQDTDLKMALQTLNQSPLVLEDIMTMLNWLKFSKEDCYNSYRVYIQIIVSPNFTKLTSVSGLL